MSRPPVVIELASAVTQLSSGGVFAPDGGLTYNDSCEVVVRSPAGELRLAARCVYVDPVRGAGLEILGFDATVKEQLARLVATTEAAAAAAAAPPAAAAAAAADDLDAAIDGALPGDGGDGPAEGADAQLEATGGEEGDDDAVDADGRKISRNIFERLRGLTMIQAMKVANSPDPSERMALERMYGKTVWEALLRNPRLTAPEVSRLARMGTLPRTMLELILNNGGWLAVPEVRRALLCNPRLGTDQVVRVLRLLPKHELKLASTLTAYPFAVRDQAKRLLKTQS